MLAHSIAYCNLLSFTHPTPIRMGWLTMASQANISWWPSLSSLKKLIWAWAPGNGVDRVDCNPLKSGSIRRRRAVEVDGCTGGHSSAYVYLVLSYDMSYTSPIPFPYMDRASSKWTFFSVLCIGGWWWFWMIMQWVLFLGYLRVDNAGRDGWCTGTHRSFW